MTVTLAFPRSALAVVAGALASVIVPPVPVMPADWAAEHLIVPDGEYAGQPFDLALTPYLREPMNQFGADSDVNEAAVRKSAQTGFTLMLLGITGYIIDRAPADMMIVQPTDSALTDFNSIKLGRAFRNTAVLAKKVRAQVNRTAGGSTTYEKKFGDYSLSLAIATSAADLSSKTIKIALLDEIDRYPADVDGQGDPCELVAGRQTMFLNVGTWKRLKISTPTITGGSAIDTAFLRGDRRYWNVVCPGCGAKFPFVFGPNFRFNDRPPHAAYFAAPCCGTVIPGYQKNLLVREAEAAGGGWIATNPDGLYPSYHFDALSSPFVPWDHIAAAYTACGDDPQKMKPFYNLYLGLPYEIRGDAPDHEMLMARREDYKRGVIPPGALLLTIAADVQMRGIYYEVVAWAPTKESWLIEADYIDGTTTDADEGAFLGLRDLYQRSWPDAYGNRWRCDQCGVDSGYRTQTVYEFARRNRGVWPLKGVDGWSHPSLGSATPVDIDYRGRKWRNGVSIRAVGTWPLKSLVHTRLALTPVSSGTALNYPTGYCHFPLWADEAYFKQLTAEYLIDETYRGQPRKVFKVRNNQDNHYLDCRVYNTALADPYLASMTADQWAELARDRGIAADLAKPDLFGPRVLQQTKPIGPAAAPTPAAPDATPPVHPSAPAAATVPAPPVQPAQPGPPVQTAQSEPVDEFDSLFAGLADLNRNM